MRAAFYKVVGRTSNFSHYSRQVGLIKIHIGELRHAMKKWKKEQNTFLIPDLRSYPFAYPTFSEQDAEGYQVVTYPPERTAQLVTIVNDSDEDFEPEPPHKKMKSEDEYSN